MKLSTFLFISLLFFTMAEPIAPRIVRTEEAAALISTIDTSKETDDAKLDSSKEVKATSASTKPAETTEKKQLKAHKKVASKTETHEKKHKKHRKEEAKYADAAQTAAAAATPAAPTETQPTDLLDAKIKQVQEETEREIASLKAQKEKKVIIIKRQEELKRLNDQQKALADELAKLDDKPAEKAPEKPAPTPVTTEWKVEQTAKFNRYSTELADTIAMGESDDAELQDFKQIFKDQQQWFDTTMTSTKYVSDDGYASINERTKCLGLLVTAQKRALPLLMKEINMKKISKTAFDRLSTLLLYNLNSQINDAHAWNKVVPEDNAALIAVVKDTIAEAKDPAFNKQTPAQKALIELQKKLKDTQNLIEDRNKKVLELEMNIASNTEKLTELKKDLEEIEQQKTKSEKELKELQQKSANDISALKAEKTKIESQLAQAQAEAKEAKTKLDAAAADSTKTAQEKAELQTQSKDLAKKVEDLQDKKRGIEQNLDEEQHKRRELEIQIEQAKFKQEQTETDRKKLSQENDKLDSLYKEMGQLVEKKNHQAIELKLELERLRQRFASHKKLSGKRTKNTTGQEAAAQVDSDEIAAMREDFERQISDLKNIILKQQPEDGASKNQLSLAKPAEEKPAEALPAPIAQLPQPTTTATPPPALIPMTPPPLPRDIPSNKTTESLTPFPKSPAEATQDAPAPVVKLPEKEGLSPEDAMNSLVGVALKPLTSINVPSKPDEESNKALSPSISFPGKPTSLNDLPAPVAKLPGDLEKKDVSSLEAPKMPMPAPQPTPVAGPDLPKPLAPMANNKTPEPSKPLPGIKADAPAPVAALPDYLNKSKASGASSLPAAPSMPAGKSSIAEQNKQDLTMLESNVKSMKPANSMPAATLTI